MSSNVCRCIVNTSRAHLISPFVSLTGPVYPSTHNIHAWKKTIRRTIKKILGNERANVEGV
uniref:Uncharacterized protein n=1 Tax=Anguilla anguilla TaxID=7936 RepID=A0A0E9ST65_ANGAN